MRSGVPTQDYKPQDDPGPATGKNGNPLLPQLPFDLFTIVTAAVIVFILLFLPKKVN